MTPLNSPAPKNLGLLVLLACNSEAPGLVLLKGSWEVPFRVLQGSTIGFPLRVEGL